MYHLRPATSSDAEDIRALIRAVRINPIGMDWRRFIVAVDIEGNMIGCVQVKPHRDDSRELASLAVTPQWRGRGVARALVEHLLDRTSGPLYLTCRSGLGQFYEKFGFHPIGEEQMPPYFRRVSRLFRALVVFSPDRGRLLVMKRD